MGPRMESGTFSDSRSPKLKAYKNAMYKADLMKKACMKLPSGL